MSATPATPTRWTPGRPEAFAACVPVIMVLTMVILALCGFGNHESRVRLGLDAPDAPSVVAPVGAPAVQAAPVRCEEDAPCWDPATMGNGYAGATWTPDGAIHCPAGMAPHDTEAPAVGVDGVICRALPMIATGVPAHSFGVITLAGIDFSQNHASVFGMTHTATPAILANRARCLTLAAGTLTNHGATVVYPIRHGVATVGRVEQGTRSGTCTAYRVGHPDPIASHITPAGALDAARDLIAPHLI